MFTKQHIAESLKTARSALDLPQVDLRNASSERERRSRSREVDLSYLQGFQLHFAPKNVNKLLAINQQGLELLKGVK